MPSAAAAAALSTHALESSAAASTDSAPLAPPGAARSSAIQCSAGMASTNSASVQAEDAPRRCASSAAGASGPCRTRRATVPHAKNTTYTSVSTPSSSGGACTRPGDRMTVPRAVAQARGCVGGCNSRLGSEEQRRSGYEQCDHDEQLQKLSDQACRRAGRTLYSVGGGGGYAQLS